MGSLSFVLLWCSLRAAEQDGHRDFAPAGPSPPTVCRVRSRLAWLAVFIGCWAVALPLLFLSAAISQQDSPGPGGFGLWSLVLLGWALFVAPFILRMLKK